MRIVKSSERVFRMSLAMRKDEKNMKVLEKFQIYLLSIKKCKQDWMIYALWVRTKIHNAYNS